MQGAQGLRTMEVLYKFLRFGLVGAAASLLYAVLAYGFIEGSVLPPTLASAAAYSLAIPFSFIAQKFFTFKARGDFKLELPRFLATQAVGLLIATVIMAFIEKSSYEPLWGITAVVIAVPLLNFLLMNNYVFKKESLN